MTVTPDVRAAAARMVVEAADLDFDAVAAAAHTPAGFAGAHQLHEYWTRGEGLAKWASSAHPWTELYHHLLKYIHNVHEAKATAAAWYHDVFGTWPGKHDGHGVHAAFDPSEPRDPHTGKWGLEAGSALRDTLKLAGKIDLGQDEKLVGSDKLDADVGGIRMALTETHGAKSLRLGIGGAGFGTADDDAGPWHGNRIAVDASPAGYTAKLDPAAAEKLRDTLTKALADGKAKQKELDDAYHKGLPDPPRPAQGFWTIAEGSVPGEWADVAWNVYLDDPAVGVEVHIGAVPPGETLDELTGAEQAARLDPAEAQKFLRLLGRYSG